MSENELVVDNHAANISAGDTVVGHNTPDQGSAQCSACRGGEGVRPQAEAAAFAAQLSGDVYADTTKKARIDTEQ